MAAFKETGGIEYSADVLLGLQSSFAESETGKMTAVNGRWK